MSGPRGDDAQLARRPVYVVLLVLGWAAMIVGLIGLALGVVLTSLGVLLATGSIAAQDAGVLAVLLIGGPAVVGTGFGVVFFGVGQLALGALMLAIRDIARNSWSLRRADER